MILNCININNLLFFLLLETAFSSLVIAQDKNTFETVPVASFLRPVLVPSRLDALVPEQSKGDLKELGRMLFFDPRLSRSSMMSCATCHNPSFYWTDSLKVSIEKGTRRSMSLLNIGSDRYFAWQGRSGSITSMIKLPLSAPSGMNTDQHVIESNIASIPRYQELFNKTFEHISKVRPAIIDLSTVGYALEMFVSSIVSPESRFDLYVKGQKELFTDAEQRGFEIFRGKGNCAQCHTGWKLSDGQMYDIGLKVDPNDGDLFRGSTQFKAVGLRAISSRPPYMHNGSFLSLEKVVEFYNRGGDEIRPSRSEKIKRLQLSDEEKKDILAFLLALDEEPVPMYFPRLPR